jgi:hypothetical protein
VTAAPKAIGAERAESMLQMVESHAAFNFHFLWTGDESWMLYEHHHETMWVASWEEVDELERPTHYRRKTMITLFFNGTGESFLNMLLQNRSVDTITLLERLLADWKTCVIPQGETRTKGQLLFILTMRPRTIQERSWNNWSSQGSIGWAVQPIVRIWPHVTYFFLVT